MFGSEDVLFADSEDCADNEISEQEAIGFTETSLSEGLFPAGVVAVIEGHISPDDGQVDGEYKMFASILLRIEAHDMASAESFTPPQDLLTRLVDMMAPEETGSLEGNWEILEVDEVIDPEEPVSDLSEGQSGI